MSLFDPIEACGTSSSDRRSLLALHAALGLGASSATWR
jgi:hypothetical protein